VKQQRLRWRSQRDTIHGILGGLQRRTRRRGEAGKPVDGRKFTAEETVAWRRFMASLSSWKGHTGVGSGVPLAACLYRAAKSKPRR
jgi:hypothetical protein